MATQWFYHTAEGQSSGPIDSKELRRLAEAGIVTPNTLVRKSDSGRWVRAEQVRGVFKRTMLPPSSSQVAAPPVQGRSRHTTESPLPSPTSAETKFAASSEFSPPVERREDWEQEIARSAISKETNECKGHLIQLVVCFLLLAGVFLLGFLLDAAGEVPEFFVQGLSLAILIFGVGMLVATFRLFWNGGHATWEAARMIWAELRRPGEASTSYEVQPTELSKAVREQVAEKTAVEKPFSSSGSSAPRPLMWHAGRLFARGREACAKRLEILELAAFFAMVGSLMLIGVLFQGIIRPTHLGKYQFNVNRGALGELLESVSDPSEDGAGVGQIDERGQAIIDRHKNEARKGSLFQSIAQGMAELEMEARQQQRAYAEQAAPEVAEPVREMLSNLGDRNQVLRVLRQMTPEQREEALRVAPGVGQQMGDDRVVVFSRCVAAFSRGVTHGWVNPIMELVGIGGTEKEIQFIRQLDEIATQEFHPYRPGDPWSERVPLQAIELSPWVFVIGGLMFIAFRWKARSAQMKHATALGT